MNHPRGEPQHLIDVADALSLARERALSIAYALDLARDLTVDRGLVVDGALAVDHNLVRGLVVDLDRVRGGLVVDVDLADALDRARALADDLDHVRGLADALDHGHDLDRNLADAVDHASNLADALAGAAYAHSAARAQDNLMENADEGGPAGWRRPGRFSLRLTQWATRLLPPVDRPLYRELYRSELAELAQDTHHRRNQVVYTIRVLLRALPLRRTLRAPIPAARQRIW